MSRLIAVGLLVALAACGGAKAPVGGLRDTSVPIRSIVGHDMRGLQGQWHEAAHLAPAGQGPCGPGHLRIEPESGAFRLTGQLCLGGRAQPVDARAVVSGPGRLALSGGAGDWWLLWADGGNRTMVLAPPSGAFALVLDRGRISQDRLVAARQILEFNGFDTARLR